MSNIYACTYIYVFEQDNTFHSTLGFSNRVRKNYTLWIFHAGEKAFASRILGAIYSKADEVKSDQKYYTTDSINQEGLFYHDMNIMR